MDVDTEVEVKSMMSIPRLVFFVWMSMGGWPLKRRKKMKALHETLKRKVNHLILERDSISTTLPCGLIVEVCKVARATYRVDFVGAELEFRIVIPRLSKNEVVNLLTQEIRYDICVL